MIRLAIAALAALGLMNRVVLIVVVTGALAYLIGRVVKRYRAAEGTPWERLLSTANDSATILWNGCVAVGGLGYTLAINIADFFNSPDVRDFVTARFDANYVGLLFVGVAAIGILARMRSLMKDDEGDDQ